MKKLASIVAAIAVAGSMGVASAAPTTASYTFASGGKTFADLSVSGLGSSTLTFTLTTFKDWAGAFGKNAYVNFLDLNAKPNSLQDPTVNLVGHQNGVSKIAVDGTNWNPYDFQFLFGSDRNQLTANETVSWSAQFGKNSHVGLGSNGSVFGIEISGLGNHGHDSQLVTASLAPAVPEPGEWAMMLAGLGMLGVIVRRRTQSRA